MSVPLITYAFVSTLAFTSLDASLGYLTNVVGISTVQIILIRTVTVSVLMLGYLYHTRAPEAPFGPPHLRRLLLARAALLTSGLFLGYASMHYLTLSEYMVLYCLVPFFTAFLCWIFVNEPFSRAQAVCCCVSVFGVIMITDPLGRTSAPAGQMIDGPSGMARWATDDHLPTTLRAKLIGLSLYLPDIATTAGEMVIMRFIKEQASTVQILTYLSFWPAISSALVIIGGGPKLSAPDATLGWALLAGVVPLGLIGQYTLTYAMQRVPAVQVAMVQYTGVVIGTLLQWLLYRNHPSGTAFIGMTLILSCAVYTALHEDDAGQNGARDSQDAGAEDLDLPLLASRADQEESRFPA